MIKQIKIKATGSTKFSSGLHTNFQQAMYAVVTSVPAPDLKAWRIEALLPEWKQCIDTEVDINRESQATNDTKRIAQLDEQRDRLISYIFGTIRLEATVGILPGRPEAGERLLRLLKTYKGLQKEGYQEQTAHTDGLINDLQKAEDFQDLKTLGLDAFVSQLKTANEQFMAALLSRTTTQTQTKLPTSVAQRRITSEVFGRVNRRIEGAFDFCDTDAERERINYLVTLLNGVIDDYRARYNRATGQTASGGGGGTTPSITPNRPTDPDWEEPADGE